MKTERITDLMECIKQHIDDHQKLFENCELRQTDEYGCGIFATRDIEPNEVLFRDVPLMLGPSGKANEPIVCVVCYRKIDNEPKIFLCDSNCGLIICKSDKCAREHKLECILFKQWRSKNPNEISFKKMKAVIIIRSMFLNENQRKFLSLMQKNFLVNKFEMYFAEEFDNFPDDKEIIASLRNASAAVNTNAFQVLYRSFNSGDINIRGFYPVVSLMNHHCTPNTRRIVDNQFSSYISTTRRISKDEQIFTTYSQLLWGTNSRRMQLMASKQFLCICSRCTDPNECGTYISAVNCQDKQCNGMVLPIDAINFKSDAKCNKCTKICKNNRYLQIQEIASSMVKNFQIESQCNLKTLVDFMEKRLKTIIPECNQFVIELKLRVIWKYNPKNFEGEHSLEYIKQMFK